MNPEKATSPKEVRENTEITSDSDPELIKEHRRIQEELQADLKARWEAVRKMLENMGMPFVGAYTSLGEADLDTIDRYLDILDIAPENIRKNPIFEKCVSDLQKMVSIYSELGASQTISGLRTCKKRIDREISVLV